MGVSVVVAVVVVVVVVVVVAAVVLGVVVVRAIVAVGPRARWASSCWAWLLGVVVVRAIVGGGAAGPLGVVLLGVAAGRGPARSGPRSKGRGGGVCGVCGDDAG